MAQATLFLPVALIAVVADVAESVAAFHSSSLSFSPQIISWFDLPNSWALHLHLYVCNSSHESEGSITVPFPDATVGGLIYAQHPLGLCVHPV